MRLIVGLKIGWVLLLAASQSALSNETDIGMEPPLSTHKAPVYQLPGLDGNIRATPVAGQWTLLNFWATYCSPCREEMPALNRLNQSMQNSGLQIHAIALDGDRQSSIEKFKNRYSLDLTILLDVETGISKAFSVSVLPVSYLVNDNGDIVGRFIGMRNWDADYFREFLLRQMASN